jgi:prefoldin subunit 5
MATAWNSVEAIDNAIQQYKQQRDHASTLLNELQAQILRLDGAIGALEQVQQNGINERAEQERESYGSFDDITLET